MQQVGQVFVNKLLSSHGYLTLVASGSFPSHFPACRTTM